MSDRQKPTSKLSVEQQTRVAIDLKSELRSMDEQHARERGHALCESYSASIRREIITRIGKELVDGNSLPPPATLEAFLLTQERDVTPAIALKHAKAVLEAAMAYPGTVGKTIAANLLHRLLRPVKGSINLSEDDLRTLAGTSLRNAGAVLCSSLVASEQTDLDTAFLTRWFLAASDVFRDGTGHSCFTGEQASRVLTFLCDVQPNRIPSELLLSIPRLIAIAGQDGSREFLQKAAGQTVRRLFPFLGENLEQKAAARPMEPMETFEERERRKLVDLLPSSLDKDQREFLKVIGDYFRLQEEKTAARRKLVEEVRASLKESRSREDSLKAGRTELRAQLDTERRERQEENENHGKIREGLEKEATNLKEELVKWKAEVRLKETELKTRLSDLEHELEHRLHDSLSRPLEDFTRRLIQHLQARSDDRDLQSVGIAFDALHVRLLKLLKSHSTDHRIPAELIGRPMRGGE